MKITLILSGRTEDSFIQDALNYYLQRLKHYITFQCIEIPSPRSTRAMSEKQISEKESELILKHLNPGDTLVLLDEHGKEYRSVDFAAWLQMKMNQSTKNLVFICGGPYGFSEELMVKVKEKLSLSKMTFPHQLIRVFFVEQVYRAFTILKNEPYHHE